MADLSTISMGFFGVVFDSEADALAFRTLVEDYREQQAGQRSTWSPIYKHPEHDRWFVTYSPVIDHLLMGMPVTEITFDWMPWEYVVPEPPPFEEEEPPAPPPPPDPEP